MSRDIGVNLRQGQHTWFTEAWRVQVPEYRPPPRTEAWLTLPAGAVVARDLDPDYDAYEHGEYVGSRTRGTEWYPQVRSEVARRFRDTFGNQAALDWDLEPESMWLMEKTMRDVFTSERLEQQFFDDSPWVGPLAKIPLYAKDAE